MGFKVHGKVALVTGCNRGIGKSIVEKLLASGVSKVYAAVRDIKSVEGLVKSSNGKVVAIELDLSKPDTIAAAAAAATDVELVINNAGVLKEASPLSESAVEALEFELQVNLFGLLHMAQQFAPILAKNGGGAFVQLNSVVSVKSFGNVATYSASKAASYSLTQSLREVLGQQGTQVLSVHPGPIATDMATAAGLIDIAEPPSLVADGIVSSLESGEFHLFPDSMAKSIWAGYESFAKSVVEADMSES